MDLPLDKTLSGAALDEIDLRLRLFGEPLSIAECLRLTGELRAARVLAIGCANSTLSSALELARQFPQIRDLIEPIIASAYAQFDRLADHWDSPLGGGDNPQEDATK